MPALLEQIKKPGTIRDGDLAIEVIGAQLRVYEVTGKHLRRIAYSDTFMGGRFLHFDDPSKGKSQDAKDFTVARLYKDPAKAKPILEKYFNRYVRASARAHLYYSGHGPSGHTMVGSDGYFTVPLGNAPPVESDDARPLPAREEGPFNTLAARQKEALDENGTFKPGIYIGPEYAVGDEVMIVRRFGWKRGYTPVAIKPPVKGKVTRIDTNVFYPKGPKKLTLRINPKDYDRASPGVVHTEANEIIVQADEVRSTKQGESIDEAAYFKPGQRVKVARLKGRIVSRVDNDPDTVFDDEYMVDFGDKGTHKIRADVIRAEDDERPEVPIVRVLKALGKGARKLMDALRRKPAVEGVDELVTPQIDTVMSIMRSVKGAGFTPRRVKLHETFADKVKAAKSWQGPAAEQKRAAAFAKLRKQANSRLLRASHGKDDKAKLKALRDLDLLGDLSPNLCRIKKELEKSLNEVSISQPPKDNIFIIHREGAEDYVVAHSVHEDPMLGYQELETGLSQKQAESMVSKMKTRWKGAKVFRFTVTGHGHKRKFLRESDNERIKAQVGDAVRDPENSGLTLAQILRKLFKSVDEARGPTLAKGRIVLSKSRAHAALQKEVKALKVAIEKGDKEEVRTLRMVMGAMGQLSGVNWERYLDQVDLDKMEKLLGTAPKESVDEQRMNLKTKEEVNYRAAQPDKDGEARCADCAFTMLPDACRRVNGKIDQDYVCDLWKRGISEGLDEQEDPLAKKLGLALSDDGTYKGTAVLAKEMAGGTGVKVSAGRVFTQLINGGVVSLTDMPGNVDRFTRAQVQRYLTKSPATMEGVFEAAAQGKAQAALLAFVEKMSAESDYALSDVAKRKEFVGVHFKQIMKAAKVLSKKGLIWYDGEAKIGPKRS